VQSADKMKSTPRNDTEEIATIRHTVYTESEWQSKYQLFGIMDGQNKVGRPHREWVDDSVDWCRDSLQDRLEWREEASEKMFSRGGTIVTFYFQTREFRDY